MFKLVLVLYRQKFLLVFSVATDLEQFSSVAWSYLWVEALRREEKLDFFLWDWEMEFFMPSVCCFLCLRETALLSQYGTRKMKLWNLT